MTYLAWDEVRGKDVLEVGSYDVNGSLRSNLKGFDPASYVGVDITEGPGVDEVCNAGDLVKRFGRDRFDLVVSTEMLEHVRDWRVVISNLKNVLKPGGILLVTTRSKGFGYHLWPFDFWRYEGNDMKILFSDMSVEVVEPDPLAPGIFVKARKPTDFVEHDLSAYQLYSIIKQRRCTDVDDMDLRLNKLRRRLASVPRRIRKRLRSGESNAAQKG
jgi:SAM-dependent methyltransferase